MEDPCVRLEDWRDQVANDESSAGWPVLESFLHPNRSVQILDGLETRWKWAHPCRAAASEGSQRSTRFANTLVTTDPTTTVRMT